MFGRLRLFIILNSIITYLLDSRQSCSAMYDTKRYSIEYHYTHKEAAPI